MSLFSTASKSRSGIRPVNLSTDLAPLADLIELVFADSMDSGGRAALSEMRMLSKLGTGANLFTRLNDLALGIQLGFVWVEDQKIIGNVSIYPARLPDNSKTWIIANVGTHPAYQRRGIARQLMQTSLDQIRQQGGETAILQVDYDNIGAQHLYLSLGFIKERAWVMWRRNSNRHVPTTSEVEDIYIRSRRRREWHMEYELARLVRPAQQGGIGWLRPLHPSFFRTNFLKWLENLINLRHIERLVVDSNYADDEILASLLIERGFGTSTRLTLMVHPDFSGQFDEALISTAVRRFSTEPLLIEHPKDDTLTDRVLEKYAFRPYRTAYHMRLDF